MTTTPSRPVFPPGLGLSAVEVLTTTRAVRRRLDLTRPVPRHRRAAAGPARAGHQTAVQSIAEPVRLVLLKTDPYNAVAHIGSIVVQDS